MQKSKEIRYIIELMMMIKGLMVLGLQVMIIFIIYVSADIYIFSVLFLSIKCQKCPK